MSIAAQNKISELAGALINLTNRMAAVESFIKQLDEGDTRQPVEARLSALEAAGHAAAMVEEQISALQAEKLSVINRLDRLERQRDGVTTERQAAPTRRR